MIKAESKGCKVLIVDDLTVNLILLRKLLERLNIEILEAESGMDAIRLAGDHEFALVLLDIRMPGMDGYETAQNLRSLENNKDVSIIFITAEIQEKDNIFKGFETGAVDYLFKPLDTTLLLNKVKVFCKLYEQKKLLAIQNLELAQANQKNREKIQAIEQSFQEITRVFLEKSNDLIYEINKIDSEFEDLDDLIALEDQDITVRRNLVKLMNLSVDYWEQSTGKTKIELAEQSGLWLVSLDSTVPRVKTLDRYLRSSSLPQKPRWKIVVNTAEYVLSHCPEDVNKKIHLESSLINFKSLIQADKKL